MDLRRGESCSARKSGDERKRGLGFSPPVDGADFAGRGFCTVSFEEEAAATWAARLALDFIALSPVFTVMLLFCAFMPSYRSGILRPRFLTKISLLRTITFYRYKTNKPVVLMG